MLFWLKSRVTYWETRELKYCQGANRLEATKRTCPCSIGTNPGQSGEGNAHDGQCIFTILLSSPLWDERGPSNRHIQGCFVVLEKIFEILAKCIVSVRLGKLAWHSLNANWARICGKISLITLWAFDLRLGRGVSRSPNLQPRRVSLRQINCPSFILFITSSKCVSVTIRKVQKMTILIPSRPIKTRKTDRWSRMVIINVQQYLARDWVWLLNW